MSEVDPRSKNLVRLVGFLILALGLAMIYAVATSPGVSTIHIGIAALFGISILIIGLVLILPKYPTI